MDTTDKTALPEPSDVMTALQQIAAATKANADAIAALAANQTKAATPPEHEPSKEVQASAAISDADIEAKFAKMWADRIGTTDVGLAARTIAGAPLSKEGHIRVKEAAEKFSDDNRKAATFPMMTKRGIPHPHAGEPVTLEGRQLFHPSDRQRAVTAVFLKWQIFGEQKLSDHEKEILQYALHHEAWSGNIGGEEGDPVKGVLLTDAQRKAVINDSTSGGTYAVPNVFDDDVVLTPMLENELFPYVDIENIARGNYIDGVNFGTLSLTTGTAEGSAITAFTTTGLIGNLDTTIYPVRFAIEMGRDWQEDTPINWARLITQRVASTLGEWLDQMVMNGTGSSQPVGIINGTAHVVITSANGTDGPLTVGDAETLVFGVDKAHRSAKGGKCRYVMNDDEYRRFRAIPVGTTDARRVFDMNQQSYTIFNWPVSIVQNTANGTAAFANLAYYKMYRRLGSRFESVTTGSTLVLKNTELIVFHARYGGQPRLGTAFAVMTDGAMTG